MDNQIYSNFITKLKQIIKNNWAGKIIQVGLCRLIFFSNEMSLFQFTFRSVFKLLSRKIVFNKQIFLAFSLSVHWLFKKSKWF